MGMPNFTTVQLTKATREHLEEFKIYPRETYEEIIRRLVQIQEEAAKEPKLKKEALKEIEEAKKEVSQNKVFSTEQLIKEIKGEKDLETEKKEVKNA